MSVRRAQAEISSAEFAEWIAYCGIDPFGEERDDLRAALVACTVANTFSKKRYKPADFMPDFDKHTEPMDAQQLEMALKRMFPPEKRK
jgi:hypothetical protein